MARRPRLVLAGAPHHVVQRGNNRSACFITGGDKAAYMHWLRQYSDRSGVAIHAWVLMSNHVHILATPSESNSLSLLMQGIGRQYVRYFNKAYERTGTLWEGRFRSCVVQSGRYFLNCQRYIELNPVRAGMVEDPGDFTWSSYQSNSLGTRSSILTPHATYLALADSKHEREARYRSLFQLALGNELVDEIRESTRTGLVLGEDRFKQEVSHLTGQRTSLLKPGPPVSLGSE